MTLRLDGRQRKRVMNIEDIRLRLSTGLFEFSRHAFRRVVERNISEDEIREAGITAEIIEDYPDDKYSPSCLVLGFTKNRRPPPPSSVL